jgi:hypothetical protein
VLPGAVPTALYFGRPVGRGEVMRQLKKPF